LSILEQHYELKQKSELKLFCECKVCSTWQDFGPGIRECRKISCFCDERVAVVVKQNDKDELTATYECVEKYCGYRVVAHSEHCRAYVTILNNIKEYIFFHTPEKCECGKKAQAILERLTVGRGVADPTKERSIDLNNELQLLFVCAQKKCSYRKSVPQIVRGCREGIQCVCSRFTVYNPETCVFSCPAMLNGGGCGVCFHQMDSLTYVHTQQAKTATEDHAWLMLARKARKVCQDKPGILKYQLDESTMHGELVYECGLNNSCRQVLRDILSPILLCNGTVI
jgi:hypothetical protein